MRISFVVLALAVVLGSAVIVPAEAASAQAAPGQPRTLQAFINGLVAPDLDRFWTATARDNGLAYRSPRLRLFRAGEPVYSACGTDIVGGHMYCSADSTLYLDVGARTDTSFSRLWQQDRDFAIVLIIAHEWGHHLQHQMGLMRPGRSIQQVELQADCMAGLYARYGELTGKMEPGDLEEGLAISLESGDPTHGTGRERSQSFMLGYRQYSGAACGPRG